MAFHEILTEAWIHGRETVLNRLAGASDTAVLNPGPITGGQEAAPTLAADLRESLNRLKVTAMDEGGTAVDYAALRRSPAYAALRADGLARLRSFAPHSLPTPAAQRAFWVNLYNVLVLNAVLAADVRISVTEGRLGTMTFFRRAAYVVAGQRVSLEDIEHGILRANRGNPFVPGPHFGGDDPRLAWVLPLDPRLHFALNCGGVSCPPIRVYTAEQLDAQLDQAARNFITNTVTVDPGRKEVQLSRLLKWYEGDFGGQQGALEFVIAQLPDDARRAYLERENGRYHITYAPYNWSLNTL